MASKIKPKSGQNRAQTGCTSGEILWQNMAAIPTGLKTSSRSWGRKNSNRRRVTMTILSEGRRHARCHPREVRNRSVGWVSNMPTTRCWQEWPLVRATADYNGKALRALWTGRIADDLDMPAADRKQHEKTAKCTSTGLSTGVFADHFQGQRGCGGGVWDDGDKSR